MMSIDRLQAWYESMTAGDWHHTYGITIENIDNPGWELRIDLQDTGLYGKDFIRKQEQRENVNDWIHCRVENGQFKGFGGPRQLDEIITIFLDWADANVE